MRIHSLAPVYFMMFNDVVKSIFLNLYLATIIDKLDGAVSTKNRLFESDFERFEAVSNILVVCLSLKTLIDGVYPLEQVWLQYDKKATGRIPMSLLRPFLRRLKAPLGGPGSSFSRQFVMLVL